MSNSFFFQAIDGHYDVERGADAERLTPIHKATGHKMGEFFKGWRRKTALITLIVACTLTHFWVIGDKLCFCVLVEGLDRATWRPFLTIGPVGVSLFVAPESGFRSVTFEWVQTPDDFPFSAVDGGWRWQFCGFQYGDAVQKCGLTIPHNTAFWVATIPYWSIVPPLTLVSAYLFFITNRAQTRFSRRQ